MTTVDVRADHLATAARYAAELDHWPVVPRFDPVQRWYHRLAQEPDHEAWLLTWLPGQGTDLHDHGGASGALHIVSGSLFEDTVTGSLIDDAGTGAPVENSVAGSGGVARPAPAGAPRMTAREFGEGAGRRFGPRHIHRITNRSSRPAISVHVYAPRLSTMTHYRLGAAGLHVLAVDRAGQQW